MKKKFLLTSVARYIQAFAAVFAQRFLSHQYSIIVCACGQTVFGAMLCLSGMLLFDYEVPLSGYPLHFSFFNSVPWQVGNVCLYLRS